MLEQRQICHSSSFENHSTYLLISFRSVVAKQLILRCFTATDPKPIFVLVFGSCAMLFLQDILDTEILEIISWTGIKILMRIWRGFCHFVRCQSTKLKSDWIGSNFKGFETCLSKCSNMIKAVISIGILDESNIDNYWYFFPSWTESMCCFKAMLLTKLVLHIHTMVFSHELLQHGFQADQRP